MKHYNFNSVEILATIGVISLVAFFAMIFIVDPWTDPNDKAYWGLIKYCETCNSAKEKAEIDFKNNQIIFVQLGLDDENTSKPVANLLKTRFNIKTVFGGCGPVAKEKCYHNKMVELAIKTFGIDTLNKSILEARNLSTGRENNYPNIIYKQY